MSDKFLTFEDLFIKNTSTPDDLVTINGVEFVELTSDVLSEKTFGVIFGDSNEITEDPSSIEKVESSFASVEEIEELERRHFQRMLHSSVQSCRSELIVHFLTKILDKEPREDAIKRLTDYRDEKGQSHLESAFCTSNTSIVRLLLQAGVEYKADPSRKTLPHLICSFTNCGLVDVLVQMGLSLDERDSQGKTPFTRCLEKRNFVVAFSILEKLYEKVDLAKKDLNPYQKMSRRMGRIPPRRKMKPKEEKLQEKLVSWYERYCNFSATLGEISPLEK